MSNNPQETTDQFDSRAWKLQMRKGFVLKNPLPGDPKVLLEQAALLCSEHAVIRRLLFNCHPKLRGAVKRKLDRGFPKTIDAAEAMLLGLEKDAKMTLGKLYYDVAGQKKVVKIVMTVSNNVHLSITITITTLLKRLSLQKKIVKHEQFLISCQQKIRTTAGSMTCVSTAKMRMIDTRSRSAQC